MNSNEIDIIYKYDKNLNKIKLFGENFVNNNKNNCILLINNDLKELCEYYEIKENKNITVKLIEKNKMRDVSYMFYECKSLLSIINFSKCYGI